MIQFSYLQFLALLVFLFETGVIAQAHNGKRIPSLDFPPVPSGDECSSFQDNDKFDCYPEPDATEEACQNRGCCWIETDSIGTPFCFYPSNYGGLHFINITDTQQGKTAYAQRTYNSPYPNDISIIRLDFKFETQQRLHIKIYDPSNQRFEPPIPEVPVVDAAVSDTDYDVTLDQAQFGFQVVRKSNNEVLFNTLNIGGFIFSDQFLQISTLLPSSYIYGLGEHRTSMLLSTQWQTLTMWARDNPPGENANLYGSHPFYMVMESSGNSHGVLLLNSNAMDVVLQPKPALTFRPIGGILDLYFFLGPSPYDVINQYTDVIGKPQMPPYWGLGFHLSRDYGNLSRTMEAWSRTRDAGIPFDVQWNDVDYMQNTNMFTYDRDRYGGLPDFVNQLHDLGMHYIPSFDPGVSGSEPAGSYPAYDEGIGKGLFIKDASSGDPFVGQVWNPVSTVWVDFTNPDTLQYWTDMLKMMHDWFQYDGAWLDMNEPSNLKEAACNDNSLNNPPYLPKIADSNLYTKTVCMDCDQSTGKHYNLHNLYGFYEAIVTNKVLAEMRQKRPFIISRSTFPGAGHFAGRWSGDVYSSWHDMAMSIPDILNFNMFGVPLTGSDICGYNGDVTEELCERWMELGSFYPFCRNHNQMLNKAQDPVSLGPEVTDASRKALLIRYSFLPYLYTLFFSAYVYGATVARPLFFEFPSDTHTYNIDTQFLWGSGLLIIPVLEEGKTDVTAYLPEAQWYDYYTSQLVSSGGETVTLSAPLDTIPLLLRGGTIFPTQVPGVTTTESRQNNFELLVVPDEARNSHGFLFWDDGDTIGTYEAGTYNIVDFDLKDSEITITASYIGYSVSMTLGTVTVLGVDTTVTSVSVNEVDTPFTYDETTKVLKIENLNVPLTEAASIKWS